MKLSRRSILGCLAFGAVRGLPGKAAPQIKVPDPQNANRVLFEAVSPKESGISFVHDSAMSANRYLPETMGPGAAFLDYDNDGWMDLYLVNAGPCDFYKPSKSVRNALYRNNRDGTFTDVTETAGVGGGLFGMGVAVGDFDNDGWPDLFVTGYKGCRLYRNNRNGTFSDVTKSSKIHLEGWTTSAVWFDYDNDGRLDLFVCQFVDYAEGHRAGCGTNQFGKHFYCIPKVFEGSRSYLFHNNGDGTFSDVSMSNVIGKTVGKGLGVVATDVNSDGRMDLFVANDTVPNFLYVNRGPGPSGTWQWDEIGLAAQVAFSENGKARSGMGVDAADVNQDGFEDLFVANVDQEMFSLYLNNKDETFRDEASPNGISQATRLLSGWGVKFFDYDNDGRLDLIMANGHPDDMISEYSLQVKWKEPLLLFHHEADGKLRNVSAQAGPAFQTDYNARGLAVGDWNNDGALDAIIAVNGGAPLLLKNRAAGGNNWLGLKLVGTTCNRDAIGARVFWTANGTKRSRLKISGGSYLSSHDPRMVLGLAQGTSIEELAVQWPGSRQLERFPVPGVNQYITLTQGKGQQ